MKKVILPLALLLSSALYQVADAQLNVRINIGSQPVWGPIGYDYVDYYYFPDADIYYNVPQGQYIYLDGPRWVSAFALPPRYRSFDPYRSYKVVINEPEPYRRNNIWHAKYYGYRGQSQQIIYNSHDPRYFVIERHPEHNRWMQSRRSNDYGRRNDNGDRDRWDRNDNRRNDRRNYDGGNGWGRNRRN
jgi:hypothetical protein